MTEGEADSTLPGLTAEGVSFGYRPSRPTIHEFSHAFRTGAVTALLGPNASGKSTLLKLLAGLLRPSGGRVQIGARDLRGLTAPLRARQITYLPPMLRAEFPLTALEAVRMVGAAAAPAAMERAQCWALRDRALGSLSGGERQLVALARALAQGSRILLVDEGLSQMDLHHQARIGRLLRELAGERYTILLVAHDVNLATEWADECVLLREGRSVCAGRVEEVVTSENLALLYPGARLTVGRSPASGAVKVFFGG